jgi:hypothetical protein
MSEWQDISTAPDGKAVWVATPFAGRHGTGFMEPARRLSKARPWRNIYTDKEITWEPSIWQHLPFPPSSPTDSENEK